MSTSQELELEGQALYKQASVKFNEPGRRTAEEHANIRQMMDDAGALMSQSKTMAELEEAITGTESKMHRPEETNTLPKKGNPWQSFGSFLSAIHGTAAYGNWNPQLKESYIKVDDDPTPGFDIKNMGWVGAMRGASGAREVKDLTEAVGADGGFTVIPEYRNQLMALTEFMRFVRSRAMVIPMRARQITLPTLDQTGSTSGVANLYGGVIPKWTAEAASKEETQPAFRQMEIIAHKLICYTEASDELLADSAIGLETLLSTLFGGAIANEEEWAFINGSGAGQPLGIVSAGCGVTIRHARAAAGAIGINDVFNLLSHFMGQSPIWLAYQSTMPQILSMNGPAGNPSYVWIGNGRDAMPTTLMGFPVYFIENCSTLGNEGDLILADWSKYVIGDRQTTTVDASKHFRFQNDLTAWRAVHRVGGRPWLSAPLTLRDGTTEVSPFCLLNDAVGS